jgi:ribulose-bisphosphate carboxylase large chain
MGPGSAPPTGGLSGTTAMVSIATCPLADRFTATYLIETPLDPRKVADVMAGEQSSGTFTRVAGETDELRDRTRAAVVAVEELDSAAEPSLPNAWLARKDASRGPWRRARITLSFPVDNVGANLPTLASIVAGNLFDLGEVTGLRLESMALPAAYRRLFPLPTRGIAGTRRATGVTGWPDDRLDHQAQCRPAALRDRRAGRAALRRRARLHQG